MAINYEISVAQIAKTNQYHIYQSHTSTPLFMPAIFK